MWSRRVPPSRQGLAQSDNGEDGGRPFEGTCQLFIGVRQGGTGVGSHAGNVLGQYFRAVAIALGKHDVDAQRKRPSSLYLVDQGGDQVARPRPLPELNQALAVDPDNDHGFAVPFPGQYPLVVVELCLADAEQRLHVRVSEQAGGKDQQQQGKGSSATGTYHGEEHGRQGPHSATLSPS